MEELKLELPVEAQEKRKKLFQEAPYVSRLNEVHTNWYGYMSFLPKCLLLQFRKLSIVYFSTIVLIMMLGFRSRYFRSPLPPWGVMVTLILIMLVNFWTQAKEDLIRRREDEEVNTRSVIIINQNGEEAETMWGKLQPGDVVKVFDNEEVPADIIVLDSPTSQLCSDSKNQSAIFGSKTDVDGQQAVSCYVETSGVDGETNLKQRFAPFGLAKHVFEDSAPLRGCLSIPPPSSMLTFHGQFIPESSRSSPVRLQQENLLLRGSIIRNSKYVIGLVVYVGHDTKVMHAQTCAPSRLSKIERLVNRLILMILVLFIIMVAVTSLIQLRYRRLDINLWYLGFPKQVVNHHRWLFPPGLVSALVFVIVYKNVLPIILPIAIDICSAINAQRVSKDESIRHPVSGKPAQCRSASLSHEIGQVQWVFTDKTGTLTENNMRLVGIYTNKKKYGVSCLQEMEECGSSRKSVSHWFDGLFKEQLSDPAGSVNRILQVLSLCHTVTVHSKTTLEDQTLEHVKPMVQSSTEEQSPLVVPTRRPRLSFGTGNDVSLASDESGSHRVLRKDSLHEFTVHDVKEDADLEYNAESPDELALVRGVQQLGFQFMGYQRDWARLQVFPVQQREDSVTEVPQETQPSNQFPGNDDLHGTVEPGSSKYIVCKTEKPVTKSFKLKAVNAFTSKRKCMSTLYLDGSSFVLYAKGADEKLLPRCSMNKQDRVQVEHVLHQYAKLGLRTLVVAERRILAAEAADWLGRFQAVQRAPPLERESLYESLAEEIETGLDFVGVTAIEDRLQAGVPETISKIRQAGVPIWILTGDKVETAVNIAFSSQLIDEKSTLLRLVAKASASHPTGVSAEDLLDQVRRHAQWLEAPLKGSTTPNYPLNKDHLAVEQVSVSADDSSSYSGTDVESSQDRREQAARRQGHVALVLDGRALELLLACEHGCAASERELMRLVLRSHVVVGCRTSPSQKKAVVQMVQKHVSPPPVTLAIGDGANDVGMIQTADVGVGVSGVEGSQAVNASDFSVGQFRFLQELMFVHGHYAYLRISKTVTLIIYSSLLFTFVSFSYNFYNDFSGQALFNELWYTMWSLFVSSVAFAIGLSDFDHHPRTLLADPSHYALGRDNKLLNNLSMVSVIFIALCHSKLLFLLAVDSNSLAIPQDAIGGTMYLCLVGVMSFRGVQVSFKLTRRMVLSVLFNILLSVVCVTVVNVMLVKNSLIFEYYGAHFTWWFVILCSGFLTASTTVIKLVLNRPLDFLTSKCHWYVQALLALLAFGLLCTLFYAPFVFQ